VAGVQLQLAECTPVNKTRMLAAAQATQFQKHESSKLLGWLQVDKQVKVLAHGTAAIHDCPRK
jgi:hypothetical protein